MRASAGSGPLGLGLDGDDSCAAMSRATLQPWRTRCVFRLSRRRERQRSSAHCCGHTPSRAFSGRRSFPATLPPGPRGGPKSSSQRTLSRMHRRSSRRHRSRSLNERGATRSDIHVGSGPRTGRAGATRSAGVPGCPHHPTVSGFGLHKPLHRTSGGLWDAGWRATACGRCRRSSHAGLAGRRLEAGVDGWSRVQPHVPAGASPPQPHQIPHES